MADVLITIVVEMKSAVCEKEKILVIYFYFKSVLHFLFAEG